MNNLPVYYLKHPGISTVTNSIYFEKRENLMQAVNTALSMAMLSCNQGYPFNIEIGCTFLELDQ